MKPVIVKNHVTGNNEVLIQDDANRLVLIGEDGKILWKKNIAGEILGDVYQVDKYKNNKLQYMFNTSRQFRITSYNVCYTKLLRNSFLGRPNTN